MRDQMEADALFPGTGGNLLSAASSSSVRPSSRWYLRVLGRGLRLKHFTLEFRIHCAESVGAHAQTLTRTLDDLQMQTEWQARLHDKAHLVHELAQDTMQQQMPPKPKLHHADSECELEY